MTVKAWTDYNARVTGNGEPSHILEDDVVELIEPTDGGLHISQGGAFIVMEETTRELPLPRWEDPWSRVRK